MWFFFQPGVTIRSSKGQIVYQSIRKGIFEVMIFDERDFLSRINNFAYIYK